METTSPQTPKYAQLHAALLGAIERGEVAVGERLGTETDIARKHSVSIITVRRALEDLRRQGLVSRRRGAGTYVTARHPVGATAPRERTLLVAGWNLQTPEHLQDPNWFIGYELQRGVINTFGGRVRLIPKTEIAAALDALPPEERALIWLNPDPEGAARLDAAGVPWVGIGYDGISLLAEPNRVGLDRFRGIYEGMTHLVRNLGHRDVAMVAATVPHPDRMSGYANSLRAFGLPWREELIVHAPAGGSVESGREAMTGLLARGRPFTAVFVDTDLKALGVIRALRDRGLRVPHDVSVLGFDDVPGIDQADPPLTTVRVPRFEMGVAAVRMLAERLTAAAPVAGRMLATQLIVRGSCAPRRA
jgi:DNA-binding LacI/PurR family transcriptional regulator